MDNAARWFLAGIFVSLVNTALVLAFIGIPGITDRLGNGDARVVEVQAPAVTHVIVVDEAGNVVAQRSQLTRKESGTIDVVGGGVERLLASVVALVPAFVEVSRPTSVSARDGVAWVVTQGNFELWRVEVGDDDAEKVSLRGIDDLDSKIVDIDATGDGHLYLLIADGDFDWRLFRRDIPGDEPAELLTSSDLTGWPADVSALAVSDNQAVYIAASDPAGIFRTVPPFSEVAEWVAGLSVLGVDANGKDSLLLYAAPETAPADPVAQIGRVKGGEFGTWRTQYSSCASTDGADAGGKADAATVPQFPRDVAIVDAERALVVDSLNHVVRLQVAGGEGETVFGVACEQGDDERHLLNPRGAAIDELGNVFISDTANDRVVVLSGG